MTRSSDHDLPLQWRVGGCALVLQMQSPCSCRDELLDARIPLAYLTGPMFEAIDPDLTYSNKSMILP